MDRSSVRLSPLSSSINIHQSKIDVECVLDSYAPEGDNSLFLIRAYQFTHCLIDCLAFITGQGFSIVFDHLVEPDGSERHFRWANEKLAALSTVFPQTERISVSSMFSLVALEPPLFLALNDLIAAIAMPGLVAINCARCVEGLREALLPEDQTRERAWDVFNHVLNLERSYTNLITKASAAPRHGIKWGYLVQTAEFSWSARGRS